VTPRTHPVVSLRDCLSSLGDKLATLVSRKVNRMLSDRNRRIQNILHSLIKRMCLYRVKKFSIRNLVPSSSQNLSLSTSLPLSLSLCLLLYLQQTSRNIIAKQDPRAGCTRLYIKSTNLRERSLLPPPLSLSLRRSREKNLRWQLARRCLASS